jgi:hypothetical protein
LGIAFLLLSVFKGKVLPGDFQHFAQYWGNIIFGDLLLVAHKGLGVHMTFIPVYSQGKLRDVPVIDTVAANLSAARPLAPVAMVFTQTVIEWGKI